MSPGTSMTVKNHSAKKLLRQTFHVLDVKQNTTFRRLGTAKSKHKATIIDSMLWRSIPKRRRLKQIYKCVDLFSCILQHPQFSASDRK